MIALKLQACTELYVCGLANVGEKDSLKDRWPWSFDLLVRINSLHTCSRVYLSRTFIQYSTGTKRTLELCCLCTTVHTVLTVLTQRERLLSACQTEYECMAGPTEQKPVV